MKTYLVVIDDTRLKASPEQILMSINGVRSVTDTSRLESSSLPFTSGELDEFVLAMEEDNDTISLTQLKKNLEEKFEGKWVKKS